MDNKKTAQKWNIKILYSSESTLTIPLIKTERFSDIPSSPKNYYLLEQWIKKNKVHTFSKFTEDLHYKFLSFRPWPHFIYAIGNIALLDKKLLAVVGPRKHSPYAEQVLQWLFQSAKNYNLATISGMAMGVDTLCHNYSLENNIPTIAVLWWGLQHYLNSPRRYQIQKIIDAGGLVLSEFKLPLEPSKYTFPQRNRIIAGLSDVVFLPEANERSGSLITANYALKMKKDLRVAPNTVFSTTSKGSNSLLSSPQVQALTEFEVFLGKYFAKKTDWIYWSENQVLKLDPTQKSVFENIAKAGELSLTELEQTTQENTWDLLNYLTFLEIEGLVYEKSPWIYTIAR